MDEHTRAKLGDSCIRDILRSIVYDIQNLEIDAIKCTLEPLIKGMSVRLPIFDPGTFLYRARKIGRGFSKADAMTVRDLSYPPADGAQLGRLNRQGKSTFYCSMGKEAVFFELPELSAGDEIILGFWKTTQRMFLNNVGYTQFIFDQLSASRACPNWESGKLLDRQSFSLPEIPHEIEHIKISEDANRDLRLALSEHFARPIGTEETHLYKLTAAIAELHFGTLQDIGEFAGMLYPSVKMWANADNVGLLPWFADEYLEFRKAQHIRIDARDANHFSITALDHANKVDETGRLRWLGRLPNWTINKPFGGLNLTFAPGQDSDGDYANAGGTPCHWVAVDNDTGEVIDPE